MKTPANGPDAIAQRVRSIVIHDLERLGWSPERDFYVRIETFAALLAVWGSKLNLTAAPDDPEEIAFHIIDSLAPMILAARSDCTVLAGAFAPGVQVLDLGSGAGFPALILAAACSAASPTFTLAEARRKRASFLSVASAEMGLTNIMVGSSRIDLTTMERRYDLVTARAFAEPTIVCATAAAALKPRGRLIVYASPAQRASLERAGRDAGFQPHVFLPYEVPRGRSMVAHLLAISSRRP